MARRLFLFPLAGFAATAVAAFVPDGPLAPGRWPLTGPFGAFTWTACFMASGLSLTLGLLAVVETLRGGPARHRLVLGRMVPSALGFALIASAAYTAAARADRIERSPALALVVAVVALVALRAVSGAVSRRVEP